MAVENARKYVEYMRIAERFLKLARESPSRSVRMSKRAQAAEWLERAETIPLSDAAKLTAQRYLELG